MGDDKNLTNTKMLYLEEIDFLFL